MKHKKKKNKDDLIETDSTKHHSTAAVAAIATTIKLLLMPDNLFQMFVRNKIYLAATVVKWNQIENVTDLIKIDLSVS